MKSKQIRRMLRASIRGNRKNTEVRRENILLSFDECIVRIRSVMLNIIVIGVIALLVLASVQAYSDNALVIEVPSMPVEAAKQGWTGEVFARGVGDRVNEIQLGAKTSHPGIELLIGDDILEVVVPGQSFSFRTIIQMVQKIMDRPSNQLVLDVVQLDAAQALHECNYQDQHNTSASYLLRARRPANGIGWSVCAASLGDLARVGASNLMLRENPIVLASYLRQRDIDRAFEITEMITRNGPRSQRPWALNLQGVMLIDQGLHQEAITVFENTTYYYPNFVYAHSNYGLVLYRAGRHEDAILKYRAALEIDSEHVAAIHNWGEALIDLDRPAEAIQKYEAALAVDPDYVHSLLGWGFALMDLGRPEEAIAKYEAALVVDPAYINALAAWGIALMDLGRPEEAIAKYDAALAINPMYVAALRESARALTEIGNHDEAKARYETAEEIENSAE